MFSPVSCDTHVGISQKQPACSELRAVVCGRGFVRSESPSPRESVAKMTWPTLPSSIGATRLRTFPFDRCSRVHGDRASVVFTQQRSTSATLQAWATHPLG